MASTEKYTKDEINEFFEWNNNSSVDELIEWVIDCMSQERFDDMMTDIKNALHEYNEGCE